MRNIQSIERIRDERLAREYAAKVSADHLPPNLDLYASGKFLMCHRNGVVQECSSHWDAVLVMIEYQS